jgi:hypothetical protein
VIYKGVLRFGLIIIPFVFHVHQAPSQSFVPSRTFSHLAQFRLA